MSCHPEPGGDGEGTSRRPVDYAQIHCVTNTEWVRSFSALRRLRMTLRAEELLGERRHVGAYPAYRMRRYFFTASTFGAASCA